ncbi:hypothetical protein J0910_07835 [Nocardiopsis sp. CNT-189]|uniref:hypothetical protein n=1 Tax=Nocardiopsis oceanisediminis TaxID=2816862 RepID=UPI003B33F7F0
MSASSTSTGPSGAGPARLAVAIAANTMLFLAALGTGVFGGVYAGWLAWLWMTGPVGKALALISLAVVLAALYAAVRGIGRVTDVPLGPLLCATGWIGAQMLLVLGGSGVFGVSPVELVFLYGGMGAVMFGVFSTVPSGPR